ncbi:MAG: O-antigen ligase family protein [Candidatus Magasanikbacteria bacterium]|nr:O-antigen ligase family protein [Candidatus Magasanikbacteria bacterium]
MIFLISIYFLLFCLLSWKNFRWAILLFVVLLPTYLVRFNLFQVGKIVFPSTILEFSFAAIFLVWFLKYSRYDIARIVNFCTLHRVFSVAIGVFFLSSVVSIFVSDMPIPSFGEWRAYFLEPVVFFFILIGRKEIFKNNDLFWALGLSTLSITIFSAAQKFTGWGIATPEWTNAATRRVTAFFSSPNAVGLYVAPILMLVTTVLVNTIKQAQGMVVKMTDLFRRPATLALFAMAFLAVFAVIFTKSQGAWIGVGAGILVFIFFVGYKKIAVGLAIAGIVFSLGVPSMREAVLFQDQANKNRLRLWGYSWTFLKESPKNFVLGTGVRQFFRKVQKPYYDKYVMERLIYPHNILLNFWTEIGLLGMLAVVVMISYIFYLGNKIRKNNVIMGAGTMAAFTVLVVHGLVDVPYFKNDLAFLFWILIASVLILYADTY